MKREKRKKGEKVKKAQKKDEKEKKYKKKSVLDGSFLVLLFSELHRNITIVTTPV